LPEEDGRRRWVEESQETQEVEGAGAQDGRGDGQIQAVGRWCCTELSGARGRDRDRERGEIERSSAMALTER